MHVEQYPQGVFSLAIYDQCPASEVWYGGVFSVTDTL